MRQRTSRYDYRFGICNEVKTSSGLIDHKLLDEHLLSCANQYLAEEVYTRLIKQQPLNIDQAHETIIELTSNHILYIKQCTITFNKRG